MKDLDEIGKKLEEIKELHEGTVPGLETPGLKTAPLAVEDEETAAKILLTCVGCGKTVFVEDTSENRRMSKCKDCGKALMTKRTPGATS